MNKYPLFSHEVDKKLLAFSTINHTNNNNNKFYNISYDNNELFLQTPTFNFIEQIDTKSINNKIYNEIYLFLTPKDTTSGKFIKLVSDIETISHNYVKNELNDDYILQPSINTINISDDSNQVCRYIKVKLLDITKIEYNRRDISVDDLKKLLGKVTLKIIFEINMIWLNKSKMGLYMKPHKLRVEDIKIDTIIDFRDDYGEYNDILQTEFPDKLKTILNTRDNQLNDSIFKQYDNLNNLDKSDNSAKSNKSDKTDKSNKLIKNTEIIDTLDKFIPSSKSINNTNFENKLKNELGDIQAQHNLDAIISSQKVKSKSDKSKSDKSKSDKSKSDKSKSIDSDSSIKINKYSRKNIGNKNKKSVNILKKCSDETQMQEEVINKLTNLLDDNDTSDISLECDLNN